MVLHDKYLALAYSAIAGDRHTTVFYWIATFTARLERAKLIPTDYVILICNAVSSMRAQANDLMSSLDRDSPFPYVALCGLLVKINIFIFSTWKVTVHTCSSVN